MNKASGADGIPVQLFKILEDYTVKVLHSICQQIWKIHQWPQDWKMSVFIPIPKGNAKECSSYHIVVCISHATKFSSVQSLSSVHDSKRHARLFTTPWTTAHQASLSITSSWSLFKLLSIESILPSNHLILCRPFFLSPSILPASGSFPMIQFFTSGGQHNGVSASASVLPMNIQD